MSKATRSLARLHPAQEAIARDFAQAFDFGVADVATESALKGATGRILVNPDGSMALRLQGEVWSARASAALAPGQMVRVVAIDGRVLQVEPASAQGDAT